ncbi:MAG: methyltransferase domain-containing protein [Proteobacteria bacterium]|nr:methyltransferase domain-containing protein [Pseudomonadota bacterium]
MTVIDIGCGMGYFSMGLAELVGENGSVISVDIQQNMLNVLRRRAKRAGFIHRIHLHRCTPNTIGIKQRVDFALAFWMVHEVPCKKAFFDQVFSILKPNGNYLLVEPKVHVSRVQFAQMIGDCMRTGFKVLDDPKISWSRAVLFGKR